MKINNYIVPLGIGILIYTHNLILGYEYNQWQFWFNYLLISIVGYVSYPLHKFMNSKKDIV